TGAFRRNRERTLPWIAPAESGGGRTGVRVMVELFARCMGHFPSREPGQVAPRDTRFARCFCTPLRSGKGRLSVASAPASPSANSASAGASPHSKSPTVYFPQSSNLKLAIHVLQGLPVVLWYSAVYQKVQSSTGSTVIVL